MENNIVLGIVFEGIYTKLYTIIEISRHHKNIIVILVFSNSNFEFPSELLLLYFPGKKHNKPFCSSSTIIIVRYTGLTGFSGGSTSPAGLTVALLAAGMSLGVAILWAGIEPAVELSGRTPHRT